MSCFANFSLFADVAIDKSELSASGSLQDPRGSCYHMSSLNESKAKQLCRKHSTTLVAYPFDNFINFETPIVVIHKYLS